MAKAIERAYAQESLMEKVWREVFMENGDADCRNYRIEVRTPNGQIRYYAMKESNKAKARMEAEKLISQMVLQFNDERILWRMANDRNWSIASSANQTTKSKKPFGKRVFDYWFLPEELQV